MGPSSVISRPVDESVRTSAHASVRASARPSVRTSVHSSVPSSTRAFIRSLVASCKRLARRSVVAAAAALLLVAGGWLLEALTPLATGPLAAPAVHAQASLLVSNHVLTTRVVRTADGGFIAQDVLVGFERGTVSFQTLTQVILPRGSHQLAMALLDPAGNELERISFTTVRAEEDNWTQTLEGTWRNIRFQRPGVHELILYWQGRPAARFYFVVR